jgi:hypothetical protein
MTITNSTISNNIGSVIGGIWSSGSLFLTNATVTKNSSSQIDCLEICSGGITVRGSDIAANLNNAIVAGNTVDTTSLPTDINGRVAPNSSFNIIGNNQGMTGITNGTNGNQVSTPANQIDPRVAPLADNGGATQTHALLFGSPALNKGNSFGLITDQRGFVRPINLDDTTYPNATGGDGSDIGAFETQTAPAAPTAGTVSVSGRVMMANGRGIRNVQITLIETNGQIKTATTTAFGYYRFDDVMAVETIVLSAKARRFKFNQSTIIRTITNRSPMLILSVSSICFRQQKL